MANVLDKIMDTKVNEVARGKQKFSVADFQQQIDRQEPPRGFVRAIADKLNSGIPAVIAEVKKASPSKGIIRTDFDPEQIAKSYQRGGASCLSVLTDVEYFKGSEQYLKQVKAVVDLPILRKDFMLDPWQIYESRAMGADCVLLIVACLDDEQLHGLYSLAKQLGMDVLVEVHDEQEMLRALKTDARLIGVNNRNLKSFETTLETSQQLRNLVDDSRIIVSESGIHSSADIQYLQQQNIYTYLIGESLMRHAEPGGQLVKLLNGEVI
ncbi:MAG: indole-3-glycerol phosphate synthase TrpC [Marinicella sp.]|nr:indole-3-glycerol phosphate synthase TrpC [Xanthomonadales bacterium]